VTDFFSFYYLPSSVIGHQVHKTINAVYLFYYAVKESDEKAVKGRLQSLMKDALILAKLVRIYYYLFITKYIYNFFFYIYIYN